MGEKILDLSELGRWADNNTGSVRFDKKTYPNVISAFQAAKTFDLDKRKEIQHETWFGNLIVIGHCLELRQDWHNVRVEIMYDLLKKKFTQEYYKKRLLETGDAEIVYSHRMDDLLFCRDCDKVADAIYSRSMKDTFWGVYKGIGENMLGKLMMRIRMELKNDL